MPITKAEAKKAANILSKYTKEQSKIAAASGKKSAKKAIQKGKVLANKIKNSSFWNKKLF